MDSGELIANAKGTIRGTLLRADHDGYVPPGVVDWKFEEPPISYLEEGEQPHFAGVGGGRLFKLHGDIVVATESGAPFHIDDLTKYEDIKSRVGFVSVEQQILFLTDRRLLLLAVKDGETFSISFEYNDQNIDALKVKKVFNKHIIKTETDINFEICIWVHQQERSAAYSYLKNKTCLEIETTCEKKQDSSNQTKNNIKNRSESNIRLEQILALTPDSFEEFVADIKRSQGYDCEVTQHARDGGIDIIAESDSNRILIQAKRYTDTSVGIKTIQRMAGLVVDAEFDANGVELVTTSNFTNDARLRAKNIDELTLVNGSEIVEQAETVGLELDDENDKYERKFTEEDILDTFNQGEPQTVTEVAAAVDGKTDTVRNQLQALVEKEELNSKYVGNGGRVWYLN